MKIFVKSSNINPSSESNSSLFSSGSTPTISIPPPITPTTPTPPTIKIAVPRSASEKKVIALNLNQGGKATDYKKHELRQHIYEICDTYIGSDEKIPREERILDLSDPKNPKFMVNKIIFPEGCERLFLEIL